MNTIRTKILTFLKWSEKYTQTDMRYLASGGFWLVLGEIISAITGIILVIAFANLIPEETYGTYKYVVSVAGIIGAFTLSGMKYAVSQAVARGNNGSLRQGFKETLKWSIILIAISLCVSSYYFLKNNPILGIGMLLIGIFYPILKSASLYGSFLEGKKNFRQKSIYLIIWEIIEVAGLVITLLVTQNVLWILFIFFLTNSIPPLLFYIRTIKIERIMMTDDIQFVSFGKHLSIMNIVTTISKHIDKVLVFQYLGATELALYSFATLPIQKMESIEGIFKSLTLPKFSVRTIPQLQKSLPRKLFFLFLVLCALTFTFIYFAPWLYEIILPQYKEAVPYARIFAIGLIFLPGAVLGNTLIAHSKKKELYLLNIFTNCTKILALIILLKSFGITGAVIALLIERLLKSVLPFIFFFGRNK